MAKQIESQKAQSTKLMHISISLAVGIFSAVILAHMAYLKNMPMIPAVRKFIEFTKETIDIFY